MFYLLTTSFIFFSMVADICPIDSDYLSNVLRSLEVIIGNIEQEAKTLSTNTDEFSRINSSLSEKLLNLSQFDCVNETQQQLQATQPEVQILQPEQITVVEESEQPVLEERWVTYIRLTSPDIAIFRKGELYYAQNNKGELYNLSYGDHNLWHDTNGDLWGYDVSGRIFQREASGATTIVNEAMCTLVGLDDEQ